jgi:hypothetical protein
MAADHGLLHRQGALWERGNEAERARWRDLTRISHHESAATAQPPASPGRVLVRVLDNPQGCLRARPCGPTRIYSRLHALATIPDEKCGLRAARRWIRSNDVQP